MASDEEWSKEKFSKLLKEELRISTLNEIKEHFSTLTHAEAKRMAKQMHLPVVFDCINDSNSSEQIDLACDVLTLCFNNLNLDETSSQFYIDLEWSLTYPHQSVKLMALREIKRILHGNATVLDLSQRTSFVCSIVKCIGYDNIAVAKTALDIVYYIGGSSSGIRILISSDVIEVIREIMDYNEVVRMRLYELAIDLAKISEENLSLIHSTGILSKMFCEINSTDLLVTMNIVEMVSRLGKTKHGFAFLEENEIVSKIFSTIEREQDPHVCDLCEPGFMKFFASVTQPAPLEMLSKYPKVFDRIFSNLETNDHTTIEVSLDAISVIGLTNAGKIALHSTGDKMIRAMKKIANLICSLPSRVLLSALHCLENLLRVDEKNNNVMQITRKWFTLFGDNPMEIITRYARNPFSDIKTAGLGILQAMAEQQWGQEEIMNTPGLIEFLLSRDVEVFKECKELKYKVVEALSTSTTLDHSILKRLQEFVKEGPFYVEAVTEMAVEGTD